MNDPSWSPERLNALLHEIAMAFLKTGASDETIRGWLTHPWDDVREATLIQLTRFHPKPALFDTLAAMVNDPVVRDVKVVLPIVLMKYGARAEAPLRKLLKENWGEVRNKAVLALADVGTAASLPDLERLAKEDPEESIRRHAATAIEAIRARMAASE